MAAGGARVQVQMQVSKWPVRIFVSVVILAVLLSALALLYLSNFRTAALGDARKLYFAAMAASEKGEIAPLIPKDAEESEYYFIRKASHFAPYLESTLGEGKNQVAVKVGENRVAYARCEREAVFFGRYVLHAEASYPKQGEDEWGLYERKPAGEEAPEKVMESSPGEG